MCRPSIKHLGMPPGERLSLRRNSNRNSVDDLHPSELPTFPELERAIADAKDGYGAAKASAESAAKAHQEKQQELEAGSAANKGKVDPAVEAEVAELEEVATSTRQAAHAAKKQLQASETELARQQQRAYIRMKSERSVLQSRTNADNYAMAADETNEAVEAGKRSIKDAARKRQIDAQAKARAEAFEKRTMHFATHVESFALGWRGSWAQGQAFTPPKRAPRTVWMPPDPPPATEPIALTKLKQALGQHFYRVIDLFKRWDVDCDHTISKEELRLALGALNVPHDEATLSTLFQELDADQSGSIDFEELHSALRKHVPKRMPPNHISLDVPKRVEPLPEGTGAERRAVAALKKALHIHLGKISSLFAQWDLDGNGQISKKEVKRALAAQCIPVDDIALTMLFRKLDTDGSGEIDFHELNKLLRREFIFESEAAQARVISVGDIHGMPPTGSAVGSMAAATLRPHTSPAGRRLGTPKLGPRPSSQSASRIAFEKKMARGDHADLAAIFADRDDAAKRAPSASTARRDQNRIAPPAATKTAGAADLTRSRTEPKLVKR